MWVAGTEGVSLLVKQRFESLRNTDGTPFLNVSGIVEDSLGGLWLNGGDGVTHIVAGEVDAFMKDPSHALNKEILNTEDGLRQSAPLLRPLPTAFEGGVGRVWFITTSGAYWIDPKHILRNVVAPTVLVRSIIVNGKSFFPQPNDIEMPSHTTSFEVEYTATSLSSPTRIQFRYKLEGVDKGWQDAGNRRQAFYTNVPPGTRSFRVIASNEDGVWSDIGATAILVIPPSFYQTWTFYLICAFSGILMLWQMYLLRIRQVRRQLQTRLRAQIDERERIARELHDTVLQSAQGLVLFVQSLAGRLERNDPMRKEAAVALDRADDLISEARDRVSDLRMAGVDVHIESMIAQFGADLFKNQAVHVAITSGTRSHVLSPSVAEDIYRICREALTNIYLHANASTVTVAIDYDASSFKVHVKDDGCGLDGVTRVSASKPGHFGLQGMRERALRHRGAVTITSNDDHGTTVAVDVPADTAYVKNPRFLVNTLRLLRRMHRE